MYSGFGGWFINRRFVKFNGIPSAMSGIKRDILSSFPYLFWVLFVHRISAYYLFSCIHLNCWFDHPQSLEIKRNDLPYMLYGLFAAIQKTFDMIIPCRELNMSIEIPFYNR